jgi:acetyl-CoA carboxylase biotin carboxyl carrier protein
MDIAELKRLVKLMNENDLVELEIQEQGATIRLKKSPGPAYVAALPPGGAVFAPLPNSAAAGSPAPPSTPAPAAPAAPPANTTEIKSPIVGTFYRSASPEAPAYVEVGDRVKPDSVVCIVEAMKVMNEIKAEVAGEIVEILAENGQAVEFDQPLFRVKTD